ncbi:hypothetical protein [Cerasicoccus arenae]|uniref:DUF4829 domain-containing protein n=1 Tax=Cerasicoccus arenae TaxID=424488 RepID=A0A8J3DBH4_9BACT|nr:hypothetical protein [Cerasicoccus arenae]MBK1856714.1 hypothetical protein [Cerasicoccus arenae]GHB99085.1 hypothetical protein GCM10007047_13960 [Cerasicoccus arenae]
MKLKNLIGIIVLGAAGYFGYTFLVTNFSAEAMVYKRYASALLDSEPSRIKTLVADNSALEPFKAGQQRKDLINGEVRFTWYEFKDKKFSNDGKSVTLTVLQKMRVDPPGEDTFYGTVVRSDRHVVVLEKFQSSWRIRSFEDTPMMNYRAENSSRR